MNDARNQHTASVLTDGKVLVTGGVGSSGRLDSAEWYDPLTGNWTTTGSMNTARHSHTASVLTDGKVLVTGGFNGNALSSAELYDPSIKTWTTTGGLNNARQLHTASILTNGKVLVVGGDSGLPLNSAELYDSLTGTWTTTGNMNNVRTAHTASILTNRKVLVTGGYDVSGGGYLNSAELYDPLTGTWTTTASMNNARLSHTASVLKNGQVLVTGGTYNGNYLNSAELYNPLTGTWTTTGSMNYARYSHRASVLIDGKVLVTGGFGSGAFLTSAELYDPSAGAWTTTSNMNYARYLHEISLLTDEKVLVTGGWTGSGYTNIYWYKENDLYVLCGNASGSTKCPDGYVCLKDRGINPDFGYTSFDNYGWAMLACFRLMTQDYWENLYQLILSAAGRYHFLYFLAIIFFGSFYLVNLILAIVSMSYLEQQKLVEAENAEREKRKIEDDIELKNEKVRKTSKAHGLLHVGNGQCFEDPNGKISHSAVSVEYEQNEKKNELNNIRSFHIPLSTIEFDKSNFILSNATISKAITIPILDETQQNSANEDKKSQRTIGYPNLSQRNQNHIDSAITAAVAFFILDAFVDLFITICIILNTLFMALDQPGQSEKMTRILTTGNYIFTTIFTAESVLKIIAMTPAKFMKNGWNVFDLLIVTVSLIELGLANVKGLSVLRSFRLLRVFKLAKSWQTLNRLMSIIGKSLGALGNLTLVLIIIIFIFAVVGMQLFGQKYADKFGKDMPRWNFFDFFHAFMIVFRVLCGEWIESMWVCLECAGWPCIPFFLLTFVIGNLVILNLFLALLLASFGSNVLTEKEDEDNKIAEAIDRIQQFFHFLIKFFFRLFDRKKQRQQKTSIENNNTNEASLTATQESIINLPLPILNKLEECNNAFVISTNDLSIVHEDIGRQSINTNSITSPPTWQVLHMPPNCCPTIISKHFSCCAKYIPKLIQEQWTYLRSLVLCIVEHHFFEWFIIISILASSTTLALEDVNTRQQPTFSEVLAIFDKIFTVIFTIELILKWFAYGIRHYFTSGWNWLDFIIVVVSVLGTVLDIFDVADIPAFKSMRTLRALRPLKALSRFEGIRVVVNALFGAIPSIFNVLLVCLVFWLIFSIMGVQLFGGKFYKCVYVGTHDRVHISENITNKIDCLNRNFTWENSRINFDNVLSGYLALFQVATFKGWIEIMADATDAKEINVQPEYETNVYIFIYFVLFIIFGSFFTLNLFIGVVIDNFNQQKRKLSADGSLIMFMTEDQKKYYNAMKKMGNKKPTKALPRPRFALARFLFDLTTNQKFDIFIMICIFLNMLCMCLEHYNQSRTYDLVLGYMNNFFVAIFTIECIIKLIALNFKYFTIPWNVFDFIIVIASILGQTLGEIMAQFFVHPTLLRVIRVARVGRILRLVKGAKGIRTLLFALVVSMPALLNIGLLLFLVMFIYSIFGM
ncbi:unnamed protein product [Rotaria sp. Silwood1]|nr:unnamed protein product [Rotaria sp. Silwood1]